MIDEVRTYKKFGYFSRELTPKSNRKIYRICDGCKKVSIIRFRSYRNLCLSCAMKGRIFSEETCKKLSKLNSGENNPMFGKYSKDNPNWNPNITDEERQLNRKYPEYTEWRNLVFKRDNHTCQICKDNTGGNLNAHHLDGYDNNSDKRISLENGITLCKKCHNNFHHLYGYGNNTKFQFIKFQINKE